MAGPEISLNNIDFHEGYGDKIGDLVDNGVQEDGSTSVL